MKKNYKRFLSLLLSIVMVIGMLPMGTLAAGQLDLGLEVIARYTSNRLTWQGESGVTYQIERSADNLQWTVLGTSDTGSYLDTGAGLGTQYYYRLTAGDAATEGVQGNETGIHALEAIAVLFYKGYDNTAFDGTNREVIAEGEAAAKLNALESGTIVYKATLNDVTTEQGVLGTDNNFYVGVRNSKFRHDLGSGFKGETGSADMVAGANTAGFVYDDSNGHWGLCANGGNVTSIDLDESRFGMLTGTNATTYYAGGSPSYPLNGTINYIMVLSEVLTDAELKALTGANQDYIAPNTLNVEVYVDREKTVVVNGSVTPDTEDVEGIAHVTYASKAMGQTSLDNTFSGDYCALEDCEYTFDKQSDGTWLISAQVDGTTVYVDPHAGASNGGYPNRTYESRITLENGTNGAFKFHQLNEGYLHFWDNDDTKLYWDQCTNDSGHTGHNMLIYRQAEQDEEASAEVPGYVQVTNAIADGGKYLIVVKTNSGSYYAMKPCKTTSNKYQHLCKVAGTVTELTIQGAAKGTGTIYAGKYTIHVQVLERENLEISLNYNYEGAPANGTLPAISGDPIGSLPVPMRQGYTFFGWYLNGEKITSSYVVTEAVTLNADWVTVPTKEKPADGTTTNGQPFPEAYENGNAYCYRIPGIVTLADGTVVAMADARWTTYGDCGGLDTIISASKDNGKTWNYTYANYLGDNGDVYNVWSATFIDPAIATDGETVYMIADLFPAGVSTVGWGYGAQAGSSGFNADGKLILRDLAGDTYKHGNSSEKSAYLTMATSRSYDFYLDPNADGSYTIRRAADDSAVEGYRVDEMLNITSGDGTIHTHLFMADSPYQVYPTNYLYLTTSTDGLNWSAPQLIVAKNAVEASLLIGPGSGTYDAAHGNMVFTAYSYPNQKTCLLWAGEDGVWHRSEDATTNVWSSEASAVVLNNGTVRVFYRSASSTLCYTDYLWVDGEYIRDVNNTSVSTAAVKNGGNGCMLTAYKYPQKVNNEEMILVATPATPGSRNDGHIYGFYVNKDGSMELVANYDITPNDSEYYAYSCLTVLTEGDEAGDLALFWEDSWSSSPAACTIHYSVIPMEDFLAGVKEVVYKDVPLTVGKTATFEDTEGYYVGADISDLDTDVATVAITGTVTDTVTAAGEAVSAIEDGTYIIFNVRANKPMTNGAASADAGNGMSLTGTKNNVAENAIWTVKAVNGGYTVQDASGKYLTIGSNTAGVTDTETVVSISSNGNTWTISHDGAYLNDFGGKGTCAAGWQHNDAPGDSGSQWLIYTLAEVPVAGTSEITFTAKGEGQTELQIGYVVYRITVAACPHTATEIRDAKDATCEEPGYTGDTWCLDCGEKTETGTETETAAHAYGDPVIVWNDDNTATATVTCANDETHVVELGVTVTSETTEGDCETAPVTTYTATVVYEEETYTSTKKVEGELGQCVDEDKDHACDVCGDDMGEHKDENKDHKCDYGCSEAIGVCEDKDNDGKCDYGCDKEFEVKPTEPDPTDPEPTEPDVTEPDPTEPDVTEPKPTDPEPTEPDATEPKPTEPEVKVEGVTRLAGENRLVTSELIANQLKAKMGVEKFQNIIVASGGTFADALPGSYLAAVKNAPIVLTLPKQKYIDQTAAYIKANLAEGGTVYILGGESAVPASMETALAGINVKRVAGADRFGTNLAILKEAGMKEGDEILVCTAKEFADSLSAAATGKPILLVYKKITDEQKTYLETLSGNTFCVVGGTSAVPENLEEAMKAYGEVSRLAGKDRLDTSILVAEKYFPDATSSVVAFGWDFPDGLCGGSLAYATKSPLILAHSKEKLAQFTADYTTKAGLKAGYVLGGEGLVDDAATRAIFGVGSEPITLIK